MSNSIVNFPTPSNEPILAYKDGSPEREALIKEINRMKNEYVDVPLIIGGKEIRTDRRKKIVIPHNHKHELGEFSLAGEKEIKMAVEASKEAAKIWKKFPYEERISIFLKAAELISTKYRYILNAATMLNQSKTFFQAEIDSTCELADFFRFNATFLEQIYSDQPPLNSKGVWNRMEYRPLEGFIFAITPFNFTSIAGNLPSAPAMAGNVVLWKPASAALLSGYYLMKLFKEAGLPDGVINFIPGNGSEVGELVFDSPDFAGIHFTGSTAVFRSMWKKVGDNISKYKVYPRIVGETGGKDFIFVHESANPVEVASAAVRGAFEYQGQKCSAASRMYIPSNRFEEIKKEMLSMLSEIKMGDVEDFKNFMAAVIDETSFDKTMNYINMAKESPDAEIIAGGNGNKEVGYFIEPTIILAKDPHFVTMEEEIFAPVLTVYVYDENKYEETLELCDSTSPYALTGSIFSNDRVATIMALDKLKNSAGNFYINDKPTGAVVGQQPFGGARGSGTNDKAGSYLNMIRWMSPITIKETFVPSRTWKL